jgi:hypothetical protein
MKRSEGTHQRSSIHHFVHHLQLFVVYRQARKRKRHGTHTSVVRLSWFHFGGGHFLVFSGFHDEGGSATRYASKKVLLSLQCLVALAFSKLFKAIHDNDFMHAL